MNEKEQLDVDFSGGNFPLILLKYYGPLIFSTMTFLVIWMIAIKPELNARAISWESHATVLKTQQEIVTTMQTTARNMQTTATIMERTVDKIDDWTPK